MVKSGGSETLMLVSLLLNRRGRFVFVIHSLVVFLKIRKPISYENFQALKRNEEPGKKTNLYFPQRFNKYWRFGKKIGPRHPGMASSLKVGGPSVPMTANFRWPR